MSVDLVSHWHFYNMFKDPTVSIFWRQFLRHRSTQHFLNMLRSALSQADTFACFVHLMDKGPGDLRASDRGPAGRAEVPGGLARPLQRELSAGGGPLRDDLAVLIGEKKHGFWMWQPLFLMEKPSRATGIPGSVWPVSVSVASEIFRCFVSSRCLVGAQVFCRYLERTGIARNGLQAPPKGVRPCPSISTVSRGSGWFWTGRQWTQSGGSRWGFQLLGMVTWYEPAPPRSGGSLDPSDHPSWVVVYFLPV